MAGSVVGQPLHIVAQAEAVSARPSGHNVDLEEGGEPFPCLSFKTTFCRGAHARVRIPEVVHGHLETI